MKYLLVLSLTLMFAMVGCDSGEEPVDPATDAASPQPDGEQPTDDATADPGKDPAEGDEPQVVEESAAVSDDLQPDDQPIQLARANTSEPAGDWQFQEGEDFQRLVPTQPTVGGADKIEVAEVFWYGCPHCLALEPYLNDWVEDVPANVRFVRIPAVWNPLVKLHAQLYYTEQVLVKNGNIQNPEEFRAAVFREYHQRNNRLASESAIQALFERQGVSADDFQAAWNSFEVAQKLRVAEDLSRRYDISSVPTIVVNGKYRASPSRQIGLPELIEVVDELVERETVR